MLYFADLNEKIQTRSRGKRDILAAIGPLFAAQRNGRRLDQALFEAMLRTELGESAVVEFRQIIINGTKIVIPTSGAFGARLQRVPIHFEDGVANKNGFLVGGKVAIRQVPAVAQIHPIVLRMIGASTAWRRERARDR